MELDWNRSEGDSGDEYARGASNDVQTFWYLVEREVVQLVPALPMMLT